MGIRLAHRRKSTWHAAVLGATVAASFVILCVAGCGGGCGASKRTLLHVSYDPTREVFGIINPLFVADWKEKTGEEITIRQSHGGSGKQARSIIDGLDADLVSLAIPTDVDAIATAGLCDEAWRARLPNDSSAYHSTIVFLVRAGNPKGIRDWGDLGRSDVIPIAPNPKTSGAARLAYLAAWAWATEHRGGEKGAREFVRDLYKRIPVLDSGARGSSTTFIERGIGDVLLTWENEAILATREAGDQKVEIVNPASSILATPPLAAIDANTKRHETAALVDAYLKFLYTKPAQVVFAQYGFRPHLAEALIESKVTFPNIILYSVEERFGGWKSAQQKHFADGGEFDRFFGEPGAAR